MRKHLGKRERKAGKLRKKYAKPKGWNYSTSNNGGSITLKLGRKKFSEAIGKTVDHLKKRFKGCVVDAER
jgi:ribosomal protein L33